MAEEQVEGVEQQRSAARFTISSLLMLNDIYLADRDRETAYELMFRDSWNVALTGELTADQVKRTVGTTS
jgi:hypothetical protein